MLHDNGHEVIAIHEAVCEWYQFLHSHHHALHLYVGSLRRVTTGHEQRVKAEEISEYALHTLKNIW